MRVVMIFLGIVMFLFALVFIESELVKIEVRKKHLEEHLTHLQNQKKTLEFEVLQISNLARIEIEAKEQGFIFPRKQDILGVVQ